MLSASSHLPVDLVAVTSAFQLHGNYLGGEAYGSGHINDTYVVHYDQAGTRVRYILQRINHRIFKDVPSLMDNIQRVTVYAAHQLKASGVADGSRSALTLVSTREGRAFHQDALGFYWRCYYFIEQAKTYDLVTSPQQAYEAARAFGEFQRLLVNLPGPRLNETIPRFHDTRRRFETMCAAARNDSCGRAKSSSALIEFAHLREDMVDRLLALQSTGAIPERITHNDTKFNNVMLDDATGRALCVIDLDTVMPGLALYDFGDMVRSATNSAAEDERDEDKVTMRMPVFAGLLSGYLASAGSFLNEAERAHLAFAGKLITFEIGLRFLTDYLEGDIYFKIKRPEQNLDRCRTQFALVRSIEKQEDAMQTMVDSQIKTR